MIRLYDYWRSSAAYRVRIALNLKGVSFESIPINIAPGADEQFSDAYRRVNPQMRVPSIDVDGRIAGQSMAILEWIDETFPAPQLLPSDPWKRLKVREFMDIIACDIHPLNNLSPLAVLRNRFGADPAAVTSWYHDWILRGFEVLERLVSETGPFAFGASPTLADVVLVPQMANARRFETDLTGFPRLVDVDATCRSIDAFLRAAPDAQQKG